MKYTTKNKQEYLRVLENIINDLESLEIMKSSSLKKDKTVVINIDIINGFCKKGALYSERNEEMIQDAVKINQLFKECKKIFFADGHGEDSIEFNAYPKHCIRGQWESEIVDELKTFIDKNSKVIYKNSTNGFFADEFTGWLKENQNIDNFILIGDCTDICVLQFALTLNGYFNEKNINKKVIVPISAVDTYDMDVNNHNAELMNLFSFYNMKLNGIEIVKEVI